ncbi:MAG: hypothetical protein ACOX88_01980 [Christensenellales bacterium]
MNRRRKYFRGTDRLFDRKPFPKPVLVKTKENKAELEKVAPFTENYPISEKEIEYTCVTTVLVRAGGKFRSIIKSLCEQNKLSK